MTDEVAELVLRDNYEQNLALANAVAQRPVAAARPRGLDEAARARRACSTASSRRCRPAARCAAGCDRGEGLTAPELSVLLAWTKIVLADELLATDLPDDPFLDLDLLAYFPTPMRQGFRGQMEEHPLRREIIVTQVVNDLVNGAGMTFWPRLAGETGATAAELTRANFVAREIFGSLPAARRARRPTTTSSTPACRPGCGSRCAPWSSGPRAGWSPTAGRRSTARAPSSSSRAAGAAGDGRAARADDRARARRRSRSAATRCVEQGVPEDLAVRVAVLPPAYTLLGIVETADPRGPRPGGGRPGALRARRAARAARCWCSGSSRCRARTAGRRWPGPRCATTCTPCTPSSPRRCSRPPRPTTRPRRGSPPGRTTTSVVVGRAVGHARGDLRRRRGRPGPDVGRAAGRPRAAAPAESAHDRRRPAGVAETVRAHHGGGGHLPVRGRRPRWSGSRPPTRQLNAFSVRAGRPGARREADARDAALAAGATPGPLHGVPIAIKEEIDVAGTVTTFGGEANSTPGRRRRRGRPPAARGRRGRHRQDDDAGVRRLPLHRVGLARDHPQPVGPDPHARRLQRRYGGRGRRRAWCRSASAATAAARSGSPAPAAGCSGSSRSAAG